MSDLRKQRSFTMADLPSPEDEQFRLGKLVVFNWGTFSNVHTIQISPEGMLILGPSGAGKSTLLDAMTALLVPPANARFNAAADEGAGKAHDRTVFSYVRGAWAEKGEEGSDAVAKQYLRPDSTCSAIALSLGNRLGREVTLVRVCWIKGSASSAKVDSHYLVAEGPFDLSEALSGFKGEPKQLIARMSGNDVRTYDTVKSYQDHWCKVVGIEDPSALVLLHRAQSMKNLSDLNTFLREYMLEEPKTFDIADRLVTEFSNLDAAHRAVVDARRQIAVLAPARVAYGERTATLSAVQANELLLNSADGYRAVLRVEMLESKRRQLFTDRDRLEGERGVTQAKGEGLADHIQNLESQQREQGGSTIDELTRQLRHQEEVRVARSDNRKRANDAARDLGWSLANTAGEFAEQLAEARAVTAQADNRGQSVTERSNALAVAYSSQKKELDELRQEIKALEESPSNIPWDLKEVRKRLCEALGFSQARLPFVGELLQVRAVDQAWAGAAERLLQGFAKSLLVDADDYSRVAKWVDQTHLGLKLSYFPAASRQITPQREPRTNSILHKLERKDHAFSGWLYGRLLDGFDYDCVASAAELAKGDKRITVAGQIRHGNARTEKDDRFPITDRRRWVLGFNNLEKLALYKHNAGDVGAQLAATENEARALEGERQQDRERDRAAATLAGYDWKAIDVATVAEQVAYLQAQLDAVQAGNPVLAHIKGELTLVKQRQAQLQQELVDLGAQLLSIVKSLRELESDLEAARVDAGALTASQRQALDARMPANWLPTLEGIGPAIGKLERALHDDNKALNATANQLESFITMRFAEFLRSWTEESGALQPELAAAPDFFAKLQRLQDDGLPAFEGRFMDLLQTQSSQGLSHLNRELSEARREIGTRMDDVNAALETVNYNPDSYLFIRVQDLHTPEPREFRKRLAAVFTSQSRATADPAVAEKQFQDLRELIIDLRSEDPEKRRWRALVLDVRRHVEFLADEKERGTGRQIEVYSGSASKSGGQRQKLTATCLAAALRYRLGGSDGGPPSYAPVVLDEAFNKTDSDFTATCMKVFTQLGFQMIVATPIKSVMTLEQFVGGAVYVTISNRHTSALLHIDYDTADNRLALPQTVRAQAVGAGVEAVDANA